MRTKRRRGEDSLISRLRELILHAKLNRTRVAADLNVDESTVRKWLADGRAPANATTLESLRRIVAGAGR